MADPARPQTSPDGPKYFGKYKGVVSSTKDPTRSGKIEVIVLDVHGSTPIWAEPCVPYADRGFGFFFLPPADTVVWVEFAAGDRSRPIWTGFLWPTGGAPAATSDEMVLATPSGSISFDARNKAGQITLTAGEMTIEMRDGAVTITAGSGVTVEVKSTGAITASSGGTGTVEVSATGTKINGSSLEVM